jgi:nitroimidazol reductase NimA-like FMN-containing flavoprotein (pyridoxamine 5'-phosphate oxidase superfamily)
MSTPASTALDKRYSAADATATGWQETLQVIEDAELSWICTVRADGRPHVTPLVAAWLDGALYFHTGAKEQKYANLRANPRVVIITGCSHWDLGVDVMVEGEAELVTDGDLLRRLAQTYASKWDGRWQLQASDGGFRNPGMDGLHSEVFRVTPTTVHAHSKGDPFGATTHRF